MPTQSDQPATQTRPASNGPRSVFANFAESTTDTKAAEAQASPAAEPPFSRHPRLPEQDTVATDASSAEGERRSAVARCYVYRLIAAAFDYPTKEVWNWLCETATRDALRIATTVLGSEPQLQAAVDAFTRELRASDFEDFLTCYLSMFGHAARGPNPMNEIEYGDLKADPLIQPHRLADLAAFYHAFGLNVTGDASERQDHICIELEFMAVLSAKEAYALEHGLCSESLATVRQAQKQFLREHLGRWLPAFTRRLTRAAGTGVLTALSNLTREFVLAECARVAVNPGLDDIALRRVSAAEALCADCGINELPPGALDMP